MLALDRRTFLMSMSLTVIALNIFRCPELFTHPRFFAEEGTIYFAGAFQSSFIANIFSAHFGYYTLYNQLATSFATLAPLDYAPLVTTLLALLVQIGISLYVLWGDLPLLDTLSRRSVLALAIPLISWPGHWLTIIGTQCWFGAGSCLLLIAAGRKEQPQVQAARAGYLLLAGLTGVASCFMAPAYLWRAVREKSKEFFVYGALLILCLLVHAGILIAALQANSSELAGRFSSPDFSALLGKTVVYQFAVPFTGRGIYDQLLLIASGARIKESVEAWFGVTLPVYDLFIIPLLIGTAIALLALVIIVQNRSRLEVQTMTLALFSVSLLSNLCSANTAGGPRYYFIPSLILLTLCLSILELKNFRPVVAATTLLVVTTLLGNGYEYRSIMSQQAFKPCYPDWQTELHTWRLTPSYQLNIWPTPWKMNLDKSTVLQKS